VGELEEVGAGTRPLLAGPSTVLPLVVRAWVVSQAFPAAVAEITVLTAKPSRTTLSPGPSSSVSLIGRP
jgi:hypothetical protein